MPLLKRLKNLDWPTLLTEVVLIFVGITAALWFDNLNQSRDEERRETQVLEELGVALASDTADLRSNLRATNASLQSLDTVLAYLRERRPYHAGLDAHFATATTFTNFIHNTASYEHLRSVGLGLISADDLRSGITQYYEVDAQYLIGVEINFVNTNWNDSLKPLMLERFSYAFFLGAPATPHDYPALLGDLTLHSALLTTREILAWKNRRTQVVIDQATELMTEIQEELAAR